MSRAGWEILGQNIRGSGFELDIVAAKFSSLKIVEVKLRKLQLREVDLNVVESLSHSRKKKALLRGAHAFLADSDKLFEEVHFDLIVLIQDRDQIKIRHFPDFMGMNM